MKDEGSEIVKVSVVITCYNYGKYLKDAIISCLASTYNNFEVIVVDDGSTDESTVRVLEELELKYPSVQLIRQENMGLPGARNAGIKKATGEYILPLDADDLIEPTFLEKAVWVLTTHPQVGVVYSYVRLFGEINMLWKTEPFNIQTLARDNYIPACAMFPKAVWHKVGGYDKSFVHGYEDWDFWLRIALNGYTGYRIREVLFNYRKHGVSMLTNSNKMRAELVKKVRSSYQTRSFQRATPRLISFNSWRPKHLYKLLTPYIPENIRGQLKARYYRIFHGADRMPVVNWKPDDLELKQYTPVHSGTETQGKILYILPWLDVGGVERVYLSIFENLPMDIVPILVTTEPEGGNWTEEFKSVVPNYHNLPSLSSNVKMQVKYVLDLIARHNIQIIQLCNSKLGYFMVPIMKRFYPGIKIVDHLHMEFPEEPWDYFSLSTQFDRFLDRRVVITNTLKVVLHSKYHVAESRIAVIPNGFNLRRFMLIKRPSHSQRVVKVGFVGRLVGQKNPLLFVEICNELSSNQRDVRFDFIMLGDGPLKSQVVRAVKRYRLVDNFTFYNAKSDVAAVLGGLDVLVAPSQREGLPTVGIEAMASRVPIVASSVPGWKDLIQHESTGLLVSNGSPANYSEAIMTIVQDSDYSQRIADNAFNYATSTFTVERMVHSFVSLYKQLESK